MGESEAYSHRTANGMRGSVDVKMGSERNFGLVFSFVSAVIALAPVISGGSPRVFFLVLAFAFAAVAFLAPRVLRVPNRLWFRFGMLLGAIVAPIVMTLVYVTTFVPIGLGLRLTGKDLLSLRLEPQASSYWIDRPDAPKSMKLQY